MTTVALKLMIIVLGTGVPRGGGVRGFKPPS